MSAHILDGKLLAAKLKSELKTEVIALRNRGKRQPCLISIVVGEDQAGQSYVLSQERTAEDLGISYELQKLSASVGQTEILDLISGLNVRGDVDGIILNKPLPAHLDFNALINAILPRKDIEGISVGNLGRLLIGIATCLPCTAASAMAHIKSCGVDIKGKEAVVIGRSEIVGKPVALLLMREGSTVTVCHSQTVRIEDHVRRADIVVAALGRKHFVKGDWIKSGAIVIDVGVNDDQGRITGDVDFESVEAVAGYLTPVPGGVGPVTSVMLMKNVIEAFKQDV